MGVNEKAKKAKNHEKEGTSIEDKSKTMERFGQTKQKNRRRSWEQIKKRKRLGDIWSNGSKGELNAKESKRKLS